MDGLQGSFSAIVNSGNATSYQWSFTAPAGAGNAPNVNFTAATSAQTSTDGHWFALPNDACSRHGNATYFITVAVAFDDGQTLTRGTQLTITLPSQGGVTSGTFSAVLGFPTIAADQNGVWRVIGLGSLRRDVPTSSLDQSPHE